MSPLSRSSFPAAQSTRRPRVRPLLSVPRILLLLCLGAHAMGQTFQYSRGWTNGRKRAFAVTPSGEVGPVRGEDSRTPIHVYSSGTDGDFQEDATGIKQRGMVSEGRATAMGNADQGRLEALLVVLGGGKDEAGQEGVEVDMLKPRGGEIGGRRKAGQGWRRNSLNESFLRRRKRRAVVQLDSEVGAIN